jgi:hypothetical protein
LANSQTHLRFNDVAEYLDFHWTAAVRSIARDEARRIVGLGSDHSSGQRKVARTPVTSDLDGPATIDRDLDQKELVRGERGYLGIDEYVCDNKGIAIGKGKRGNLPVIVEGLCLIIVRKLHSHEINDGSEGYATKMGHGLLLRCDSVARTAAHVNHDSV